MRDGLLVVLEQGAAVSDCLQASYHRLVPGTVLLGYSKEVLVVDTELGQTVGVISLERSHSSLAALALASHRELLLLLHESGSVSVWSPRPGLSVAVTEPSRRHRPRAPVAHIAWTPPRVHHARSSPTRTFAFRSARLHRRVTREIKSGVFVRTPSATSGTPAPCPTRRPR